jgi:hypothetical protein
MRLCIECAHYREHYRSKEDGGGFAPMCDRVEIDPVSGREYRPTRTCEFERKYAFYSARPQCRDELEDPCGLDAKHFSPIPGQ